MQNEVAGLKAELQTLHDRVDDSLNSIWTSLGQSSPLKSTSFVVARRLAGHFGKVTALHWGSSTKLASASQDGKLYVWDAAAEARDLAIKLESAWVMTCSMERSAQRVIACGGLDNTCSLYDCSVSTPTVSRPSKEISGHEGYLSRVVFMSPQKILTASGDSTCCVWDTASGDRLAKFEDHAADVMR